MRAARAGWGAGRQRRRGGVMVGATPVAHNIRARACYVDPVRATLYSRDELLTQIPPETAPTARAAAVRRVATARGLVFCASELEGRRYCDLLTWQHQGLITDLRRQVRYPLEVLAPTGELVVIGHWIADAVYVQRGVLVVEDAKGQRLDMYRWKARHFAAQYGQSIHEVRR